jgi:hypothetical protein
MKTIYFPQTLIAPALAEVLPAGFGPLTLLQPSREGLDEPTAALAETNRCELVFPCREDAAAPGETIEALRRWAAEHAGQDLAGLLRRAPAQPFFDADASARIAAEVKSGGAASPATSPAQRLERARLLLVMAQEFDRSHHELASDLQRLEAQERRMMALLKGESDAPGVDEHRVGMPPETAPLSYMLAERLEAWAQLALAAEDVWAQDPVVWFLTNNREVLAHIMDQVEAEILLDSRLSGGALASLAAWLSAPQGLPPSVELPEESPGPSTSLDLQLTLIGLPRLSRDRWLQWLAGNAPLNASAADRPASASSVWVAHAALV